MKKTWRKKNTHNYTYLLNRFSLGLVKVGKETYGGLRVFNYGNNTKLRIGSFCSISSNVCFILGGEHKYSFLTTYPFKKVVYKTISSEDESKGDIIVQDDVWIGEGCKILSGVTISQGAIIGAGSVVTRNIPAYAIAAGNPAKIIKKRFSDEIINKLVEIDLTKIDLDENILEEILYKDVSMDYLKNNQKFFSKIKRVIK